MWFRTLLLAGSLAICAGAAPATAGPRHPLFQSSQTFPVREREGRDQRVMSVREIESILSARFRGGHIVRADGPRGDPPMYFITWAMPNGNDYRELTVDAVTGQIR